MLIITDENYIDYVQSSSGFLPRESRYGELEGVGKFEDSVEIIPEKEWPDLIALMHKEKAFARYRYEEAMPVHQFQNGMNFCWSFSLAQAVEMIRAIVGLKYVQLAPESLGSLVGWKNAGFYVDRAIQFASQNGFAPRSHVKEFSLDYRSYSAGWQEEAKKYRPHEFYDAGKNMRLQVGTALLKGFAVPSGYNKFRHAITLDSMVYEDGKVGFSSPNTHGITKRWTLFGGVMVPDEAYPLRTIVIS